MDYLNEMFNLSNAFFAEIDLMSAKLEKQELTRKVLLKLATYARSNSESDKENTSMPSFLELINKKIIEQLEKNLTLRRIQPDKSKNLELQEGEVRLKILDELFESAKENYKFIF